MEGTISSVTRVIKRLWSHDPHGHPCFSFCIHGEFAEMLYINIYKTGPRKWSFSCVRVIMLLKKQLGCVATFCGLLGSDILAETLPLREARCFV
jgi:hypothetical protein